MPGDEGIVDRVNELMNGGENKPEKVPPFHIINAVTGKFIGPFTTELDAAFARQIADPFGGFQRGDVLDKNEFDKYLEQKGKERHEA